MEVLETRRPFRWYGPGNQPPMKVLTFEKEFAARMETALCAGGHLGHGARCSRRGGARDRSGRRGHPARLDLVLLLQRRRARRRTAGIRRDRRVVQHRPGDIEQQNHAPDQAHHGGAPAGQPCRHGPHPARLRASTASRFWRTARRASGGLQGPPLGLDGRHRHLQPAINKTITAGEGGAVVTNDPLLFERASRYHDLGGLRGPHEAKVGKPTLDRFMAATCA